MAWIDATIFAKSQEGQDLVRGSMLRAAQALYNDSNAAKKSLAHQITNNPDAWIVQFAGAVATWLHLNKFLSTGWGYSSILPADLDTAVDSVFPTISGP
jgi:hypothetical protein